MPSGTIPIGVDVPASAEATARIVPSPPAAMTTSTPSSRARTAAPSPESSIVVSSTSGGLHPSKRQIASATEASRRTSVFVGLTMRAAR